MDIDHDAGTEEWYYYITDPAGSVIGVVDENGDLVNHYDYDAFGNLIRKHSYENVPNRYQFHGREYDEHRGDYYYRHRTYVPAWGSFTGPDPVIDPYNPRGAANYLFCRNNPLVYSDPWGLSVVSWLAGVGYSGESAEAFDESLGESLYSIGGGVTTTVKNPDGAINKGINNTATVMARGMTEGGGFIENIQAAGTGTAYLVSSAVGTKNLLESTYGVDLLHQRKLSGVQRSSRSLVGVGQILLTGTVVGKAYNPSATLSGSAQATKETLKAGTTKAVSKGIGAGNRFARSSARVGKRIGQSVKRGSKRGVTKGKEFGAQAYSKGHNVYQGAIAGTGRYPRAFRFVGETGQAFTKSVSGVSDGVPALSASRWARPLGTGGAALYLGIKYDIWETYLDWLTNEKD